MGLCCCIICKMLFSVDIANALVNANHNPKVELEIPTCTQFRTHSIMIICTQQAISGNLLVWLVNAVKCFHLYKGFGAKSL